MSKPPRAICTQPPPFTPPKTPWWFRFLALTIPAGEKAAEGLRQRKKLPDSDALEAPEAKEVKGEDRCPISGKQGAGSGLFKEHPLLRVGDRNCYMIQIIYILHIEHCPDHGDA